MRALIPLVLALSCACVAGATSENGVPGPYRDVWCFQERRTGETQELASAQVNLVGISRLAEARRLLRRQTFVEIDRRQLAGFADAPLVPGGGRTYIARGSIYARAGSGSDELLRRARTARFDVERFGQSGDILITTMQPSDSEIVYAQNMPLILQVDEPVSHVFVACYSVR